MKTSDIYALTGFPSRNIISLTFSSKQCVCVWPETEPNIDRNDGMNLGGCGLIRLEDSPGVLVVVTCNDMPDPEFGIEIDLEEHRTQCVSFVILLLQHPPRRFVEGEVWLQHLPPISDAKVCRCILPC